MNIFKKSLLLNLIIAFSLVFCLGYLGLGLLSFVTKHNKEKMLPKVDGMNIHKAEKSLRDLGFELEIDSTYDINIKPGQVIFQMPRGNKKVKLGRAVFLTYNRVVRPTLSMPNFINMTFRSSLMTMRNLKLQMGDTVFKYDITTGLVLQQWYNGQPITPGTSVPVGAKIDLVVSRGLGEPNIPMQLLIGKTYREVMAFIMQNELNAQIYWNGTITDTMNAIIYDQSPMYMDMYGQRNFVGMGEPIDLSIMQNPPDSLIKANSHVEVIVMPEDDIQNYVPLNNTNGASVIPSDNSSATPDEESEGGYETDFNSPDVPSTPATNKPESQPVIGPKPEEKKAEDKKPKEETTPPKPKAVLPNNKQTTP